MQPYIGQTHILQCQTKKRRDTRKKYINTDTTWNGILECGGFYRILCPTYSFFLSLFLCLVSWIVYVLHDYFMCSCESHPWRTILSAFYNEFSKINFLPILHYLMLLLFFFYKSYLQLQLVIFSWDRLVCIYYLYDLWWHLNPPKWIKELALPYNTPFNQYANLITYIGYFTAYDI